MRFLVLFFLTFSFGFAVKESDILKTMTAEELKAYKKQNYINAATKMQNRLQQNFESLQTNSPSAAESLALQIQKVQGLSPQQQQKAMEKWLRDNPGYAKQLQAMFPHMNPKKKKQGSFWETLNPQEKSKLKKMSLKQRKAYIQKKYPAVIKATRRNLQNIHKNKLRKMSFTQRKKTLEKWVEEALKP